MPRYLPFFESSSGDLLMPSKSPGHRDRWVLAFSSSEDVRAMCPGAKLKVTEDSSASIRCVGGGQFNLGSGDDDERVVGFVELSCSRSIREKVQKTGDPCGPGDKEGKVAHIGWKTHSGFRKQVCTCKPYKFKSQLHQAGFSIVPDNRVPRRAKGAHTLCLSRH